VIVKVGFNTDFGKDKFDVGLDETDLARILAEAGIPPDALLTELEAFQILHVEAERFCAAKQAALAGTGPEADHWTAETRRLTGKRSDQLGKAKARLGIE
jgi:hypothetical protein